jgi:hypothetical protein
MDTYKPTDKQLKARRNRSVWMAVALAVFVVVVYFASLARMGPALFDRF